jgi:hypothetical protein
MRAGCERGVLNSKRSTASIYLFMLFFGMVPAAAGVCSTVLWGIGDSTSRLAPRMGGTTPEACGAQVLSARRSRCLPVRLAYPSMGI